MVDVDSQYGVGDVWARIESALRAEGKDPDNLSLEDLGPVGGVSHRRGARRCCWRARHGAGHVIGGPQMISVAQTGQPPDYGDPVATAGDDPAASFGKARDLALSTLTDEFLTKKVPSPMGEMPVDQILGMFLTNDIVIHTWDLAQAAGVPVELDPQLVDEAYNALVRVDDMIRQP